MKESRARLMNDNVVFGKGVPMMSASQKEVNINDVVYTSEGDTDKYSHDAVTFTFTAWRVIGINYKERYFRIRCSDGCERSIHHEDGCPGLKVYHDYEDAQKSVCDFFLREKDEQMAESEKHEKKANEIFDTSRAALKAAAPIPPPAIDYEEPEK